MLQSDTPTRGARDSGPMLAHLLAFTRFLLQLVNLSVECSCLSSDGEVEVTYNMSRDALTKKDGASMS